MSTTSENITNWRALSDIDYFTQFIKSYLAFNAWMRTRYAELNQDRKIIDSVKHVNNEFKKRIVELLTEDDAEGEAFRSYVSSLHYHLERIEVKNNGTKISFLDVYIEENPEKEKDSKKNTLDYKVKILTSGNVQIRIDDSRGNQKYYYEQTKYNLQNLLAESNYQRLTLNQKTELRILYSECNPKKTKKIISNNTNGILIGQFYFINEVEDISKALIEIIYSLRNTLFHGEVLPDKDTNKVYEQAYHILKILIHVL